MPLRTPLSSRLATLAASTAALLALAGCAASTSDAGLGPAATLAARSAEPARPSSRIANRDLDWSESASSWQEFDTVDTLLQASFGQDGSDFDPDVSPDGRWLAFASTQHRLTSDIYLKPVRGSTVTQLTNDPAHDLMPSFSPDGARVAFASNRTGSWDIFVMSADGGQPVQVTSESSHELHPTWSPDGARLAFCRLSPASGRWELWMVQLDNPGVTRFLGYGLLPEWSPSGDTIAFQRSRERGDRLYSIWTIDLEDGEVRRPTEIASSTETAFINPSWSPDGRRLAFSAVKPPESDIAGGLSPMPAEADLWIVAVDGSSRIRLTGGAFVDLMPDWASDGRLYFVSNRAGIENIWSLAPQQAILTADFGMTDGDRAGAPSHPAGAHPAPMPSERGRAVADVPTIDDGDRFPDRR